MIRNGWYIIYNYKLDYYKEFEGKLYLSLMWISRFIIDNTDIIFMLLW